MNNPFFKVSFFFGFLSAFCCFILLFVLYNFLKINPLGGKKEIGIVFLIIAMILAVSKVRNANGGAIGFGEAYGVCLSTTIITSFLSVLLLYIFLLFIAPNCLPEYIHQASLDLMKNKNQIIKSGINEATYLEALKSMKFTSVKSILFDDFIKKLFLSIIPSLMISLYFRRKFIN